MPEINYLAVLACGVAAVIIGSIWYGPLFGKIWMEGMGIGKLTPEQMKEGMKQMPRNYAIQFIGSLLTAAVVAYVVLAFDFVWRDYYMSNQMLGIKAGLVIWLGLILPIKYAESLWNGKKFKYVAVDIGYWLIMLPIYGLIVATWRA